MPRPLHPVLKRWYKRQKACRKLRQASDCRKTYIAKRVVRPTPINPQKAATCAWLFALLKGQVCAKGVHTAPCKNSKKWPKPLFRHAQACPTWGTPFSCPFPHGKKSGIISTVAAHVRQDTAYSVVLFTKRLLLMLHHSQNRQSRFYAALAACKSAWTCSYGIMETIISPRRNRAEGPDSRKGEMVYEDEKTGAHRPDGH